MINAIVATITFLILDAIWLGFIATKMYINSFGSIMRMSNESIQPLWPAAIVVYVALISGILFLVLPKSHDNVLSALLWGAFFGFVTYGTYDFTNLSVLADWNLKISIIDTIWGMVLCGLTSAITVFISNKI